jgi:hypothetical protein
MCPTCTRQAPLRSSCVEHVILSSIERCFGETIIRCCGTRWSKRVRPSRYWSDESGNFPSSLGARRAGATKSVAVPQSSRFAIGGNIWKQRSSKNLTTAWRLSHRCTVWPKNEPAARTGVIPTRRRAYPFWLSFVTPSEVDHGALVADRRGRGSLWSGHGSWHSSPGPPETG